MPVSVQSFFEDAHQEVQIVDKVGNAMISNKSPTGTSPLSSTIPTVSTIFSDKISDIMRVKIRL